jgi:hypothetical protein
MSVAALLDPRSLFSTYKAANAGMTKEESETAAAGHFCSSSLLS